jgi:hypothetical protein
VVGALAAGEVITLGYLERRIHYAALRALGWPKSVFGSAERGCMS